jgi:hypothetical protein
MGDVVSHLEMAALKSAIIAKEEQGRHHAGQTRAFRVKPYTAMPRKRKNENAPPVRTGRDGSAQDKLSPEDKNGSARV